VVIFLGWIRVSANYFILEWNFEHFPLNKGSNSSGFSQTDHALPTRPQPMRQKMAQSPFNGTTKSCGHRGGRLKSNHGQTMAEMQKVMN